MSLDTSPTIALVVPVYNVEAFVAECLESIRAQTYEHWECFVVDDGSTDQSGKIADSFATKDQRFHVIHKKNGGVSSARNAALKKIRENREKYQFIGFVDGDDIIDKRMYETLIHAIQSDKSQIAVCGYYKFNSNKKIIRGKVGKHLIVSQDHYVNLIFSLDKWKHQCGAGGMVWKQLYSSSSIEDSLFPEDTSLVEDEFFNIHIAKNIKKVSYIPTPLYGYRMRTNSLVRDTNLGKQMVKCREECLFVSKSISDSAYYATLAAYIHSYLTYLKNTSIPPEIEIQVSNSQINRLYKKGYITKKDYFLIRMYLTSKNIFKLYAMTRNLFRNR